MGNPSLFQTFIPSRFGKLSILWKASQGGPRILRIILPDRGNSAPPPLGTSLFTSDYGSRPDLRDLAEKIQAFLQGEQVAFSLERMALDRCPAFQRSVLLAEYQIPRGWVSTYQKIAGHLGSPRAARAVGNALARNPFPLIIPCHRAIRSDRSLGGFQGGLRMKQALLEYEGVEISERGRVLTDRWYY